MSRLKKKFIITFPKELVREPWNYNLITRFDIIPNIVAGTIYDLWIVKIVVLPLITVVQGIPIPYSTQLEAHGGFSLTDPMEVRAGLETAAVSRPPSARVLSVAIFSRVVPRRGVSSWAKSP